MGCPNDSTAPVKLLTPRAQTEGETFRSDTLVVDVKASIPGGFIVDVTRPTAAMCAEIKKKIKALEEELRDEKDPYAQKSLRSQIDRLGQEAQQLGC
jgi:hypothetical protein